MDPDEHLTRPRLGSGRLLPPEGLETREIMDAISTHELLLSIPQGKV